MMEAEQVLEKALSLADEGEWEAMADLLRESLAYHGQEAAIHCWLGVAERELGLEGLAYERFKRALRISPSKCSHSGLSFLLTVSISGERSTRVI